MRNLSQLNLKHQHYFASGGMNQTMVATNAKYKNNHKSSETTNRMFSRFLAEHRCVRHDKTRISSAASYLVPHQLHCYWLQLLSKNQSADKIMDKIKGYEIIINQQKNCEEAQNLRLPSSEVIKDTKLP